MRLNGVVIEDAGPSLPRTPNAVSFDTDGAAQGGAHASDVCRSDVHSDNEGGIGPTPVVDGYTSRPVCPVASLLSPMPPRLSGTSN